MQQTNKQGAAVDWREERRQRIARQQAERARQRMAPSTEHEEEKPKPAPRSVTVWALGIAVLAFGAIGWVLGGVFTLDGWVSWVNGALRIARLPLAIPEAVGLWRLLFIPIALVYSYVETRNRPVRRDTSGKWKIEPPLFWVGFALITLTDIGSTTIGLQTTHPAEWGVLRPTIAWVLADGVRVGTSATVLTFAPEWMIMGGVWILRRQL